MLYGGAIFRNHDFEEGIFWDRHSMYILKHSNTLDREGCSV